MLSFASPADADQIQVGFSGSSYGPYQTGLGGEFTLHPLTGWLNLSGYSAQTKDQGPSISSFQTFCIEENEYLYPYDATYEGVLTGQAENGGKGGPHPDPISRGTAYLYSQFAQGTLAGYNYGANRSVSAAALQEAIWWLEEEIPSYTNGNIFINLVASQFSLATIRELNATAGQYGVYVLNLSGAPNGVAQDQLYYKPSVGSASVPDSGTTLALLGLAMAGMVRALRRLAL